MLEIYTPEAEGTDVEALRQEAVSRLGAPLRIDMTPIKLVPTILNPETVRRWSSEGLSGLLRGSWFQHRVPVLGRRPQPLELARELEGKLAQASDEDLGPEDWHRWPRQAVPPAALLPGEWPRQSLATSRRRC